ncbi:MAG: tRNA (adenosine(37)-N6)-dimethylallyltransferase MiaA [Solobacterium sp.]|nr:tRNA (adenosine(37)-N6)-dimethylallyltransferase MiaA [Solobacterium sp.]
MKKVIVIAGPTASGKTSFSIRLARLLHTEIISGDSIQVYKGMDIGSGKVKEEEKEGIRHHLIDILSPKESYTVADFQKQARRLIDSHDEPMIICGGTGLYLKSCLYDYAFEEEQEEGGIDPALEDKSPQELYEMLKEADPLQAQKIHPHNVRRVLRSLTIYQRTGKRQSDIESEQKHEMIYDAFIAGCTMPRDVLYERINRRVEQMLAEGLEQEVRKLLEEGVTFTDPAMKGIGYKEWRGYFAGDMSLAEVKEEIQKHSRQFAKRQYTWLYHQMPVHWFDARNEQEKMLEEILDWSRK